MVYHNRRMPYGSVCVCLYVCLIFQLKRSCFTSCSFKVCTGKNKQNVNQTNLLLNFVREIF
jgi:hypothetical protein